MGQKGGERESGSERQSESGTETQRGIGTERQSESGGETERQREWDREADRVWGGSTLLNMARFFFLPFRLGASTTACEGLGFRVWGLGFRV